jgi:hypothetical protein
VPSRDFIYTSPENMASSEAEVVGQEETRGARSTARPRRTRNSNGGGEGGNRRAHSAPTSMKIYKLGSAPKTRSLAHAQSNMNNSDRDS